VLTCRKTRETNDGSWLERATSLIDRVLTKSADNYEALRLRIEVAMSHHRFPRVIEYAETLAARNPSDAGVFGLLGDALMEQGRYDEAGAAYGRMFDLGPNLFSYNRLGYHRFVTGKPAEAIQWMSQAVDAGAGGEPEHLAWCLVEYADMLFKTGKTEDAIAAYSQSLKAFPKYHRARAALGMAKAAVGNTAEAIRLLTEAQNTVPYPEYAAALADLYRLTGNVTEAERQSKRVDAMIKIARAGGEKANRVVAIIYVSEGRNLSEALELAKAEFEVRNDVYSFDALAWSLYKNGKLAEAQQASEKALQLNTPEPAFWYRAGAIALAAGQSDIASQRLRRALDLNPIFDFRYAPDAKRLLGSATG
jgi:tetratricopeptide (TPR) repeat protein